MATRLYISDRFITDIEDLRLLVKRVENNPTDSIFKQIMAAACDGVLERWLREASNDTEKELSQQLTNIATLNGDNERWKLIKKVIIGEDSDEEHLNYRDKIEMVSMPNSQVFEEMEPGKTLSLDFLFKCKEVMDERIPLEILGERQLLDMNKQGVQKIHFDINAENFSASKLELFIKGDNQPLWQLSKPAYSNYMTYLGTYFRPYDSEFDIEIGKGESFIPDQIPNKLGSLGIKIRVDKAVCFPYTFRVKMPLANRLSTIVGNISRSEESITSEGSITRSPQEMNAQTKAVVFDPVNIGGLKNQSRPQLGVDDDFNSISIYIDDTLIDTIRPTRNLTFKVEGITFKMIYIEGGIFTMGAGRYSNERPHNVTLSDYHIGETVVTRALWKAVMGERDGDDLPCSDISWNDLHSFIDRLNEVTGKNFRLPTEAEWEFAAKGGKNSQNYRYSGSNKMAKVGWYDSNSGDAPHEVKGKEPNELGIYDMSGNVWEWCHDWYQSDYYDDCEQQNPQGPDRGSKRVIRGGSYKDSVDKCDVTYRRSSTPGKNGRSDDIGFRLALSS